MIQRLLDVLKGMMRVFVSDVERDNPEALLENEKEKLRTQLARFNHGLVSHAAMCERLIRQVQKLGEDQTDLEARTRANLQAGNRETAAELALRLQTVARELAENGAQAEEAEATYRDLVAARDAAVEAAQSKIEDLRRGIDEMRIQQAMAELNEMAAGLVTSVGGSGETLNRLEQMIEDQRSRAAATNRVAREELNIGDVRERELEQQALAEQALADFAAREGIALEAGEMAEPDSDSGASKSMGPPARETE
jgi:phage shock protein A